MYALSLDLSSKLGSVALFSGETLIAESSLSQEFKHCEEIVPVIDGLLSQAGIELFQVSNLLCTHGPGSFTGLRIALTTLKAFSLVTKAPIQSFHTAEIRAMAWLEHQKTRPSKVVVFTQMAQSSFLASSFLVHTEALEHVEDEIVPSIPADALDVPPCSATLLGRFFRMAQLKNVATDVDQLISLSPLYFGSARFN